MCLRMCQIILGKLSCAGAAIFNVNKGGSWELSEILAFSCDVIYCP